MASYQSSRTPQSKLKDCTLHDGYINHCGYGLTKFEGKTVLAHRLAYVESKGMSLDDISGMLVRHTCDVRHCINPLHLLLGTHEDNMRDMTERNRMNKGEERPQSRLTEDDVRFIRENYKRYSREFGIGSFSKMFSVHPSTVFDALKGGNWKHV